MHRRDFLIWLSITVSGFIALTTNLLNKILRYISGPNLTKEQEAKLVEEKIQNLDRSVHLEKLREERLLKDKILICGLKDLKKKEGLPFVDFNLKPALAFLGKDNNPVLISSVCTHLGCTVQSKLNKGRLLCPCHITYFELDTGKALEGPAKLPLPMVPFIVEENKIYIVKHA
ncbi:MAG: ubiquinol-cytochrome c reductase iron-sulfur subunit [Candidatus Melainabacteria bacterium]|nr:ubiquinol-cytochrome c reductase iron-sulfur subunit [Candidatus Melainabacteria bacterium]